MVGPERPMVRQGYGIKTYVFMAAKVLEHR